MFPNNLAVLAFPCNQFGGQEPGSCEEISAFAAQKGANFALFDKCAVKGDHVSPVYAFLTQMTGKIPGWNFSKYLVAKNGVDVTFYSHETSPISLTDKVQELINAKEEL